MEQKTQIRYTGDAVTRDWLKFLASQPGSAWLENVNGQIIIVHEFQDQRGVSDEQTN